MWDREAATRQAHSLKIAGSIPAPTTLLALCLGKQLEVVMGKPNISIEEVKKLAEQGLARLEIARKLGCSRQYICWLVDRHNIEITKDLRKVRPKKPHQCRKCGVPFFPGGSEAYCSLICRVEADMARPYKRRLSPEQIREIRFQRTTGTSVKDIAVMYGVKPVTIYHILEGRLYSHIK